MQYSVAIMKIIVVVGLVLVLIALASAGVFMLKRPAADAVHKGSTNKRMARALAVRVGLSVALFLFVLFAAMMGWIRPGGLPLMR